jgi:hypothetical protein
MEKKKSMIEHLMRLSPKVGGLWIISLRTIHLDSCLNNLYAYMYVLYIGCVKP